MTISRNSPIFRTDADELLNSRAKRIRQMEESRHLCEPPCAPFDIGFFLPLNFKNKYRVCESDYDENDDVPQPVDGFTSPSCSRTPEQGNSPNFCFETQLRKALLATPKSKVNRSAPVCIEDAYKIYAAYKKKIEMLTNTVVHPLYKPSETNFYLTQCFTNHSPLGIGSFGYVIKAKSIVDEKFYAIKYSKEAYKNLNERNRLLAVLKVVTSIRHHDRIANIHAIWEEKGRFYIQMDLATRSCLGVYLLFNINKKIKFPEERIWKYFIDISLGLSWLHANNIIHSDIKPDNVFVTSKDICILGDFSNVMFVNKEQKVRIDSFGDGKYLAPEFAFGELSLKSDVYSLGVTLVEIACGQKMPPSPRDLRKDNKIIPRYANEMESNTVEIAESMTAHLQTDRPSIFDILNYDCVIEKANDEQKKLICEMNEFSGRKQG